MTEEEEKYHLQQISQVATIMSPCARWRFPSGRHLEPLLKIFNDRIKNGTFVSRDKQPSNMEKETFSEVHLLASPRNALFCPHFSNYS
jgi:hypothetical protein